MLKRAKAATRDQQQRTGVEQRHGSTRGFRSTT
jgi:hypothetical protein